MICTLCTILLFCQGRFKKALHTSVPDITHTHTLAHWSLSIPSRKNAYSPAQPLQRVSLLRVCKLALTPRTCTGVLLRLETHSVRYHPQSHLRCFPNLRALFESQTRPVHRWFWGTTVQPADIHFILECCPWAEGCEPPRATKKPKPRKQPASVVTKYTEIAGTWKQSRIELAESRILSQCMGVIQSCC